MRLAIGYDSMPRAVRPLPRLSEPSDRDFALAVVDAWAATGELPLGISELADTLREQA
jgi:hypothetical protein